jgi:hypothetical protein
LHAPGDLAISSEELWALRRHLHRQISETVRAFWEDRWREMAKSEQELAERRQAIERRHAAALLRKRQKLPQIDFEVEAARKVHKQNLAQLGVPATLEDLFKQLVPHLYEFASLVAVFERTVIPQLPPSERHAHAERVVHAIMRTILPDHTVEEPLPPGAQSVRLSEEKMWAGKVIAGPFEILLDQNRRPIGYRRAPYAERRGEFEQSPLGDLWGILHAPEMKRARRLMATRLRARLRSELVQMADDRRTRRQMADDCQAQHNKNGVAVTHKMIAGAAKVSINDFYQWRADSPPIPSTSIKHRRILFVVCCPVWPPPHIWNS